MSFEIRATGYFRDQLQTLPKAARELIEQKIELIRENPYRYKKLRSKHFSRVFRVRLNIQNRDSRLVYVVLEPNIILVAVLDRKDGYRDLEKHLAGLRRKRG